MRVFFRKINVVGALVSAIKFFVRKNKDRTFRQKVYALLHATPYSGPLHRYIDQLIIWSVLVSVVCIVLDRLERLCRCTSRELSALGCRRLRGWRSRLNRQWPSPMRQQMLRAQGDVG